MPGKKSPVPVSGKGAKHKKGKTGRKIDPEVAKIMKQVEAKRKRQTQTGIKITSQNANGKYELKCFPKGVEKIKIGNKKIIGGRLYVEWIARIKYAGIELLVETTVSEEGSKRTIQNTEGKKVLLSEKANEEINEKIAKINKGLRNIYKGLVWKEKVTNKKMFIHNLMWFYAI